jgi:hypothetical protein
MDLIQIEIKKIVLEKMAEYQIKTLSEWQAEFDVIREGFDGEQTVIALVVFSNLLKKYETYGLNSHLHKHHTQWILCKTLVALLDDHLHGKSRY